MQATIDKLQRRLEKDPYDLGAWIELRSQLTRLGIPLVNIVSDSNLEFLRQRSIPVNNRPFLEITQELEVEYPQNLAHHYRKFLLENGHILYTFDSADGEPFTPFGVNHHDSGQLYTFNSRWDIQDIEWSDPDNPDEALLWIMHRNVDLDDLDAGEDAHVIVDPENMEVNPYYIDFLYENLKEASEGSFNYPAKRLLIETGTVIPLSQPDQEAYEKEYPFEGYYLILNPEEVDLEWFEGEIP